MSERLAWSGKPGAGYRDRPLSFQWRLSLELVEALGLPMARKAALDATRSMILAEALLGAESGQGVSYSRRKVFYSDGRRYRDTAYTYATVLESVAELVRAGWLFEHRVKPNARGWQSSFPVLTGSVTDCDRRHAATVAGQFAVISNR